MHSSTALPRLLTDPHVAGAMAAEARGLAPAMAWPVVAHAYSSRPAARRRTTWPSHDHGPAAPVFAHLLRMTDHRATFEHACLTEPRREHGYCTDDMARVLVVATREPDAAGPVNGLAGKALQFLNEAQSYDGSCRNRMDRAGNWTDRAHHGGPLGPVPLGARHGRLPQRREPGPPAGRHPVRTRRQGRSPGRGRWRTQPSAPPNS